MSAEKTTTIRMDGRMLKRVDGLADAMSRSRAWVINQAVERYLDYEEWFVGEVRHALKQVEAGQLIDHEVVAKKWERKRATEMDARRKPRPGVGSSAHTSGEPSRSDRNRA